MTPQEPTPVDDVRRRRLVLDMLAESAFRVVATALTEATIAFAPIKGIVLARWLYRDVSERPYCDVDIVVARSSFERASEIVGRNGWPVFYRSSEMGEISFVVDQVAIEIHAEVGRLDLSRLTTQQLLARSTPDSLTFSFQILRLDEIDHFFVLVLNVIKDGFVYANPHQPEDLSRLLERLRPRWNEIVDRAKGAALLTGLSTVTEWMIEEHQSQPFLEFRRMFPNQVRALFSRAVKLHRQMTTRRSNRLQDTGALIGVALATLTPDLVPLRASGIRRMVRRWALRRLGRPLG